MFNQGTVYKLQEGMGHYYFILSDPDEYPEQLVIVNMTSLRGMSYEDTSCILTPSDHPAVEHDSWIFYGKAEIGTLQHLRHQLRTNIIAEIHQITCSDILLKKILAGASKSVHIKKRVYEALKVQNLL